MNINEIDFSVYFYRPINDVMAFLALGLTAKGEPVGIDADKLSEVGGYEFDFYGDGRPGYATIVELSDGSFFLNVHNSLKFTDTFHEPERIELRMYRMVHVLGT